jgi:hypothetical protein
MLKKGDYGQRGALIGPSAPVVGVRATPLYFRFHERKEMICCYVLELLF